MLQTVERPRFRQDLVAEAIEEGGSKFVDVGDPESGNMFRFYEAEFSIACGMDGERDVAGIVQWAKDELGLMASTKEVRQVISTLASLSFLDQGPAARAAATARPAPSAAREPELAAGVVAAQQKRAPGGIDVELGSAGAKAVNAQPMPKGVDIELGTPGAGAVAKPPRPPVEDVGLGAPGARTPAAKSDVSLDLADHMGVKADDVKEAIRQSKQISAVEVPKDLMDKVDAPVPAQKAAQKPAAATAASVAAVQQAASSTAAKATATPATQPKVEAKPAAQKPVEAKPAEKKPAEKKPVETKPVVVADKKPMPEAPRQGISPVLIILLVLAIGGAGAYFAWKYLISKKAETTTEVQPPPVTPGSQVAQPKPPAPPPVPKAKIEITPGAERDILSVFAGNVESIDTTERDVDTSDIIARLNGAKRLEAEMAALDREIERRKAVVTAAEEARNKLNPAPAEGSGSAQPKPPSEAQIKAADTKVETTMKALEDKQNERGTKEENLEKLYVRAPFEGKIVIVAKQGQKIEENTPIARITPKPAPTALFKLEKNMTLERGLAVPIKVGEKMYTCEVADSNVDGTRVVCRQNAQDLAAGAEATLMVEQPE